MVTTMNLLLLLFIGLVLCNQVSSVEVSVPKTVFSSKALPLLSPFLKFNRNITANVKPPLVRFANASQIAVAHQLDSFIVRRINDGINRFGKLSKLVLFGDSLIYRLCRNTTVWNELAKKYGAINFASPGDRTENIIHRLANMKTLAVSNVTANPLVIIALGSNNAAVGDSAHAVFKGVTVVVHHVQSYFKNSDIVLISLLPRGNATVTQVSTYTRPTSTVPAEVFNEVSANANKQLQEGFPAVQVGTHRVHFLDLAAKFRLANGSVNKDLYASDMRNPNTEGVLVVMTALEPFLAKLPVVNVNMTSSALAGKAPVPPPRFNKTLTPPAAAKPAATKI